MLPSRTCVTRATRSDCFIPRSASAARFKSSGSEDIFIFATPSTVTFMNSFVGTASDVFTSTCITRRESLSTRVKKGILHPARPISMRFFPRPEMMYAVSGGAFM